MAHGKIIVRFSIIFSYLAILCASEERKVTKTALSGRTLRCCILEEPPATIVTNNPNDKNDEFSGIAIKYLEGLEKELGFKCTRKRNPYGDISGFNRFVEDLGNCKPGNCECDIGVAGFRKTARRVVKNVDFLPPFMFSSYKVITHVSNTRGKRPYFFLGRALDEKVWLAIVVMIILLSAIRFLEFWVCRENEKSKWSQKEREEAEAANDGNWWRKPVKSFQYTVSQFISQEQEDLSMRERWFVKEVKKDKEPEDIHKALLLRRTSLNYWLLSTITIMSGLFLFLVYESAVIANLVSENDVSKFRNVNDFKLCRINISDICITNSDVVSTYWSSVIEPAPCLRDQKGNVTSLSFDQLLRETKEQSCKYSMAGGAYLTYQQAKKCGDLELTGSSFAQAGLSFVMPKLPELERFSTILANKTLQLTGANKIPSVDQWMKQQRIECKKDGARSVGWGNLKFFIWLSYGSCGVLLIVILIEKLWPSKSD